MQKRGTKNKGFTLVEVIVTLVVLVILAGTTYGAVKGLVARAEQNARDQVARSLFMAAQSALTHVYANDPDRIAELTAAAEGLDLTLVSPAPGGDWDRELETNNTADKRNLVALTQNGSADAGLAAQQLRALLTPYVDDGDVLTDHIVIEFNKETGNVLACFYTDEPVTLSHGGSGYDVYFRGEAALKNALVGYYGVDYTGSRAARLPVDEPEELDELTVMLVDYDDMGAVQGFDINGGRNYGLLTLECALPSGAPADTLYEITIQCYVKKQQSSDLDLTAGAADANIVLAELGSDLAYALSHPIAYGNGQRVVAFMNPEPAADGRRILVIVLDSQQTGAGIRDLYSTISNGMLSASVHAESDSLNRSYDAVSETNEHALYAEVGVGTGNESGKIASVKIASARHLNNVRYLNSLDRVTGNNSRVAFTQTRDIFMMDYRENMATPFRMAPIYMKAKNANQADSAFTDVYDGGGHIISGLHMPENTANAGLFQELGSGGTIEHVYLLNANITGSARAGGIAAVNNGLISRCTVYRNLQPYLFQNAATVRPDNFAIAAPLAGGVAAVNSGSIKACTAYSETTVDYGFYIRAESGSDYTGRNTPDDPDGIANGIAGGIAAVNNGSGVITSCYVGAGVRAKHIAGGIAGKSEGQVRFCEVCTAMAAKVGKIPGELSGRPYFGDFDSYMSLANAYYGEGTGAAIDPNQRWIEAVDPALFVGGTNRAVSGISGGIVGVQRDGAVDYCVNASLVAERSGVGGGVVGCVFGQSNRDRAALDRCYNAGFVKASGEAGGVAGQVFQATLTRCYNTAPINADINYELGGADRYRLLKAAHSTTVAGGIVGRVHLSASVGYCYNASFVCAGTNTAYAGAFGIVAEQSVLYSNAIENCYFMRSCLNVSERYRVGYTADNQTLEIRYDTIMGGGNKRVTMLAATDLANLRDDTGTFGYLYEGSLHVYGTAGAGPYFRRNAAMTGREPYWFPVLNVDVNEYCALRTDFHRTPYYPILDSFGGWIDAQGVSGGYQVTCYLAQGASATLRLNWRRALSMDYYTLNASPAVTGSMGAVGSTTALTFSDGDGYSFSVTGEVQALSGAEEWYELRGCTQKFVFTIPSSDIDYRVLGRLYVQMVGSTGVTGENAGPRTAVWCEDSVS